jgi:hypothetical protein
LVRVPPYGENTAKIFFRPGIQFIHQSKALVEFSQNMLFLKFFELISGQKNPKNSDKIFLFKGRFKKSCFGPKICKK